MTWGVAENPRKQITKLRELIHVLNQGVVTEASMNELAELRRELEHLYMDEEIYWRQRCKNQWERVEDRNTRFFHAKASRRKKSNTITGLFDFGGQWKEEVADVEHIIMEYFGGLFQTSAPCAALIDEILKIVQPVVNPSMNLQVSRSFSPVEVTQALSQMSPLKSLGPDGYPAVFFHKYWHIIGNDISSCVLEFLNNNRLPARLNFTFIVLIPKVSTPKLIRQFLPISLCNVVHKIGSKMIANCMKPFLNDVISPTQSAFIPRRFIILRLIILLNAALEAIHSIWL